MTDYTKGNVRGTEVNHHVKPLIAFCLAGAYISELPISATGVQFQDDVGSAQGRVLPTCHRRTAERAAEHGRWRSPGKGDVGIVLALSLSNGRIGESVYRRDVKSVSIDNFSMNSIDSRWPKLAFPRWVAHLPLQRVDLLVVCCAENIIEFTCCAQQVDVYMTHHNPVIFSTTNGEHRFV